MARGKVIMEEKINLQKYLSDNNSNLYGYLKKEIANAIKVDDLKNIMKKCTEILTIAKKNKIN